MAFTKVDHVGILVDDLEVGRIQGNDWRSPESALWDLLDS